MKDEGAVVRPLPDRHAAPGGGIGEVYRARDTRLDRDVAVKILPEQLAKDAEALCRFEREAKAVAALSHHNILAIHDFGDEQGVSYVMMELLEGETLRSRLQHGVIGWREVVEIGSAMAEGLAAEHAKVINHRDLKPGTLQKKIRQRTGVEVGARARAAKGGSEKAERKRTGRGNTLPHKRSKFWPLADHTGSNLVMHSRVVDIQKRLAWHSFLMWLALDLEEGDYNLEESHPGCSLRLHSIHDDADEAVVEFAIEDAGSEDVKQLKASLEAMAQQIVEFQRQALAEREARLQIEGARKQLETIFEKVILQPTIHQ